MNNPHFQSHFSIPKLYFYFSFFIHQQDEYFPNYRTSTNLFNPRFCCNPFVHFSHSFYLFSVFLLSILPRTQIVHFCWVCSVAPQPSPLQSSIQYIRVIGTRKPPFRRFLGFPPNKFILFELYPASRQGRHLD